MSDRHRFVALALAASALLAVPAAAQAPLISGLGGPAGYGPSGQCLSPNDDGSSAGIDITPYFPGGLRFFDRTHTRVFVNTNGNITFSGPVSTYTPESFPVADQPMIAPFWADVDIRLTGGSCMGSVGVTCTVCAPCHNPSENGVWWYGEPGRMIFTWDRVGRYSCRNDRRMHFQLILTAVEGCGGAGDFDVEFRYNRCEWEVGDASGDTNADGLCTSVDTGGIFGGTCTPAQAGFDAGNERDYVAIAGSMTSGIHTRLCTMSNVSETGVWRFNIRSGTVMCPDAGDACSTGLQGVCASGRTNCVGMGTECVQDVMPSAERCDALDNDCDGSVDEMPASLCPTGQICESGTCLAPCFEAGCPSGQVCLSTGRCIDEGCESVTCPAGQRCERGACVGACDGVTCPIGQTCRAGVCTDLCVGLTCDDCTVCEDGLCAPRCQYAACGSGETCQADGRCVEASCDGISCSADTVCRGGACVDRCTGAVCPPGQMCTTGECVPIPVPDAGPPVVLDAGGPPPPTGSDSGTINMLDGGVDAGRRPPSRSGAQCICRAPGAGGTERAPLLLLAGLLALVLARRRGR